MTDPAPTAPGLLIEVRRLAFEGDPLFRDFSLTLRPGEWTALLGPASAGKSTLLKIAAGQDAGEGDYRSILADGRSARGHAAMMVHRDALLPWLSILDNACLGPDLHGEPMPERRTRAAELLCAAGLSDYLDASPTTLSGGMRQRVALVHTLLDPRRIVLLDEPFAALDPASRRQMQNLAAELLAGRTVLAVTHDPAEALRLGHRIVVLEGKPAQVTDVPVPPGMPARSMETAAAAAAHDALLGRLLQASP